MTLLWWCDAIGRISVRGPNFWFDVWQELVQSCKQFLPTSYVFYYAKQGKKYVVAGNHRIAAKHLLAAQEQEALEAQQELPPEDRADPHLAVVQLCTNIPSEVVALISNGTSRLLDCRGTLWLC